MSLPPPAPFVPPAEPEPEPKAAASVAKPERAPCRLLGLVPVCAPHDNEELLEFEAISLFFTSRGVPPPKLLGQASAQGPCWERPYGHAGERVLLCGETTIESRGKATMPTGVFRRVDKLVGRVVRGGRVTVVLNAPYLVDMMDKDVLEDGPFFELAVGTDDAGKPVLREPAEGACDQARAKNAESLAQAGTDPIQRAWATFDASILERICKAAGRPSGGTMFGARGSSL